MTRRVDLTEQPEPDTTRQVQPDERDLLDAARAAHDRQPDRCALRLVALGRRLGIHPMRTREIARTWSNEGRYQYPGDKPDTGRLTEKGREDSLP